MWGANVKNYIWASAFCGALIFGGGAQAGDLVYTPVNPSFGGNPLNSNHLFAGANAQRTATASDANDDVAAGGGVDPDVTGDSSADFDLFVRQLQSRLLSALSSQVTDAIFGDNPQDSGRISFGDQQVDFEQTPTEIRLTITDFSTGTTTDIVVPQLVSQ